MFSTLEEFYKKYPLKKISVNNKNWEYISCGKAKETLLLFPGGGQTAQGNFRLIQVFEDEYKIIIPTIYDVDSIKEFCNAINTILQNENTDKVILYGCSIGGLLAQSYLKRNKDKVTDLILLSACTPKSKLYQSKIVPLTKLKFLLGIVPIGILKFLLTNFGGQFQGASKEGRVRAKEDIEVDKLLHLFVQEFVERYFTKRLLTTWLCLHKEFSQESITKEDFSDWKGKVLIMRSDNDPLMQDDGDFKKVYPQSDIFTFHGTGHLSHYYEFHKMVEVMNNFLNSR